MIIYIHMWGTFDIWSNTDNFAFPMVKTLQRLLLNAHLLIMQHIHTVSAFFCVESFGTYMFVCFFKKEDIYCDWLIY